MSYVDILRAQLVPEEGDRKKPYRDSRGFTSIGIGRNLDAVGISQDEEDLMFANDVGRAENAAMNVFPSFLSLSDNRKAVVADMAFNMGQETLEQFHGMIAAVAAKDWNAAADHMLASAWAREVGDRATMLAQKMRDG